MSFFSQPGILNALDPWASPAITVGLTANSEADAEQNATILQAAIQAAQSFTGGGCVSTPPDYGATIVITSNNAVPPPVGTAGQETAPSTTSPARPETPMRRVTSVQSRLRATGRCLSPARALRRNS